MYRWRGRSAAFRVASGVCVILLLSAVACAGATPSTTSEDSGDPLKGQTVEFVVPYEPGGGYDLYVRLMAPFLDKCLGAEVVPINEPGAGSLLATNQTAAAPADGTRIQIYNAPGAIAAQIADIEGAQYDLKEFSWITRIAPGVDALSVAADSEFRDFQDLMDADRPVRFVATGPGSNEYFDATVLSSVFGFRVDMITGFEGSDEARAAVLRGDADAHIQSLDSALEAIEAGDMRALLVVDSRRSESVPDVPTVYEYEPVDESQRANLDALVELVKTGRPVSGPPGLPEDVLASLREGFRCVLNNKKFLAQARENQRPVDPLPGEATTELVRRALEPSPAFARLVRESF